MQFRALFPILLLSFSLIGFSQTKKQLKIERTEEAPKIDGNINETVWNDAEIATDFIQFRPEIGIQDPYETRTEVKVTYDDKAIYVAAYIYDDPALIMRQFTARDDFGQSDFFGVVFNPNNDAQNDTNFFVTSSGTQTDAISNPTVGEDFSWNAVWESAVKMQDDGWTVEMAIPYRALRFAAQEKPTWGIQFHRQIRRTRAQSSWNPIDITQGIVGLYHGELIGLDNVEPPLRLNLYPFTTFLISDFDGQTETEIPIGLDLKYGITDNFTLDATLIPDFSQAGFDNLVLNLGPFEQTFSEQRQFFTEGVDLFSKGNLFFSRRVGNAPSGIIETAENETFTRPSKTKVLNALKVSGRTKGGLGVGIFNAITETTEVSILNEDTDERRTAVIEPFTNYNILVVDQQFNGNSSVSLINTNTLREGKFRDANATALEANIQNKRNTYRIFTRNRLSHVNYQTTDAETGFSSFFNIRKTHGNFRYSFDYSYADTKFDINDLGLNFRNNFSNFGVDASYEIFEPQGNLNSYRVNFYLNHENLANPHVRTGLGMGGRYFARTKKLNAYGFGINTRPGKQYDYFESRDGRPFIFENYGEVNGFYSSNYNLPFAYDIRFEIGGISEEGRDFYRYNLEISPRFRFNEHTLFVYEFEYSFSHGERGYATFQDDQPIFGERNRSRVTNTIRANYAFNPLHALGLSFRHYWDVVDYDYRLFTLLDNGRLTTDSGYNLDNANRDPNINFSTWNVDLSYSWQFAPGSFLTALYRNQLFNFDNQADEGFSSSLNNLFEQPILNQFSLRIQYFIDSNGIKSIFKKNNNNS
ncbi:DUF5916 domain-containing protein [Winogradskyella maritima]|uniref:DUF5916 domain-containing protein n=1 Tax=Winogradskyella maritima TaxID=1517766 RepID=A0ABV8ALE7_9FLAO|nr:DUF5916 domain-containing protein [Winogradskyella maritima]